MGLRKTASLMLHYELEELVFAPLASCMGRISLPFMCV